MNPVFEIDKGTYVYNDISDYKCFIRTRVVRYSLEHNAIQLWVLRSGSSINEPYIGCVTFTGDVSTNPCEFYGNGVVPHFII